MGDLHEVEFHWPHTEPSTVIVTGGFDNWSSSVHLSKTADGYTGKAKIPWGERIAYKFVVDGNWVTDSGHPTETDSSGNVNNVYDAPHKPAEPTANGSAVADKVSVAAQKVQETVVKPASETTATAVDSVKATISDPASTNVNDFADTIAARDGTKSTLEYVASGIGAAIGATFGVDPINQDKIPVQTPIDGSFPASPTSPSVPSTDAPSALQPTITKINEEVNKSMPFREPVTASKEDPTPSKTESEVPSTKDSAPEAKTEAAIVEESKPAEEVKTTEAAPTTEATTPAETKPPVEEKKEAVAAPERKEEVASKAAEPEPTTNGTSAAAAAPEETASSKGASSIPSTPKKQPFPGSDSATPSPASSRFGTASSRKKRQSIFGKVKNIFSHDKEKSEKSETPESK